MAQVDVCCELNLPHGDPDWRDGESFECYVCDRQWRWDGERWSEILPRREDVRRLKFGQPHPGPWERASSSVA